MSNDGSGRCHKKRAFLAEGPFPGRGGLILFYRGGYICMRPSALFQSMFWKKELM